MARQPGQVFIFNDEELELIKRTFAENETLLYTVRKVLLQFPLTDAEKNLIKLSVTPEVVRVLKKRILPEISEEFPLTQIPSILTTLTEQLKTKSVDEMGPLFSAKLTEIAYLEQQFTALSDLEAPQPIKLKDMELTQGRSSFDSYVAAQSYLFLLGYIDPMLGFIQSIAGQKDETVEAAKKRMDRNSSK